jgi:predicted DNA-binding transcriptional regulator YafY
MTKNDRLSRLLLELPWLIQNKNTSIDNFCAQFDISRDEANKDLSLLTYVGPGRFGGELVDIQYDDENISVIDSQGFDRPLKLNNIEAVLLLLGVRNLSEMSKDKQEILDIEIKLSGLIESDISNEKYKEEYLKKKNIINEAIANRKQLVIHYVDSNLKLTSERLITPLEMKALDSKEYLTALDNSSSQKRTFRRDRIIEVDVVSLDASEHEISQNDIYSEKISLRTKSWNASNFLDLNIPFTISGDDLQIELDLIDPEYLLEIILRLDIRTEIVCSKDMRSNLQKILNDRIESIL